jgi:hypothetical protein
MKYLIVKTGEAKTLSSRDSVPALATFDLGGDFAITAFNPATRTAGLAREIYGEALENFLRTLLSPDTTLIYPVLQIRIIGGSADATSTAKFKEAFKAIQQADEGKDFINIVAAEIGGKPFPQSFKLTAFDGQVGAIES